MTNISDKMRVYESYLGRLIKEYELIWLRFKLFSGMNTLLLMAISYLSLVNNIKNFTDILKNSGIHFLIVLLITTGIIVTLIWIMINWGSYQWITLMNIVLEDMEREIFLDLSPKLFKKITITKSRSKIVLFNIGLSIAFISTWGAILFILIHSSS